jgi:hypothetical protein
MLLDCNRAQESLIYHLQWFSSGTTFSEYAKGGHYKMSKADKRENIIMVRTMTLHAKPELNLW